MLRRSLGASAIALALLLFPAIALAQLTTGDLYGTVTDDQHQALPGVTLTLSGVGAPKVVVSDEKGNFRFNELYPGSYNLKADLEGFSSVEQTGIQIGIGSKRNVALTLSNAVRETITVTAEHALLNPREQNSGPVLTPTELEGVPTARDPWSLLKQAPGVQTDRINVGGNESGQQSNFYVGGATSSDNTFAVDGAIETDMAAVGASAGYYDFGAYEEFQLTTASTDTEIQTAGVTINQVTKRGTNEWRGDARYLKTDGNLQSKPDDNGYPEGIVGNEIDSVEEYGANIGGPILRDHLWLWSAYGVSKIKNLLGTTGQVDNTKLLDSNNKLNWQWGANSGSALYWDNDKQKHGRGAAFDRPPETTWDQTTPADRWKFEDTQLFGSTFTLSGLYSHNHGGFTLHPLGGSSANVTQDDDGIWHGSFWVFDQTATIDQAKANGDWYVDTGSWNHEVKFGGSYRTQDNDSISVLPGNGTAVYSCIGLGVDCSVGDHIVEWSRHTVAVKTKYTAFWGQDTLTHDRWTITAGLRYDDQTAKNKPVHDPGQPDVPNGLMPEINFAGDDAGGLDWNSLVPRLGVTYAAGADRRTLIRGTYSRYAAQLGQWVPNLVAPTAPYSYAYYYFNDANHNLQLDPNEHGSLSYYYLYNINTIDPTKSANVMDPDIKPYMTDEATLGVQHAFGNNVSVSLTYQYRKTTDLLDLRRLVQDDDGTVRVATRDDYTPRAPESFVLPNGQISTITRYRLPGATGGNFLTNGDREITFNGLTLGVERPMANHWSARGYFSYGNPKLKMGPEFLKYDDPTNVISQGLAFWGDSNDVYVDQGYGTHRVALVNSTWNFNLSGIYQVMPEAAWGFNLGGNISGRQGYPFAPSRTSRLSGAQLTNKIDDIRYDDVFDVDARIDKDFVFGDVRLTASIDAFNLLNNQVVLERNPLAPTADEGLSNDSYPVVARLSPRVFRWGVTVHFR